MENNEHSKEKLLDYLELIRDKQALKAPEEMNRELLDSTVSMLLKLQNKKVELSSEEIRERVEKIPFVKTPDFEDKTAEKRKKINKRKLLLIAAIVTILSALLMITPSGRFVDHWHSKMKERFGSVFNVPAGEVFTEGNEEFVYNGKTTEYSNIHDFSEKENYNVLIPTVLPEKIDISSIMIPKPDKEIIITFTSGVTSYAINMKESIPQAIIDNVDEIVIINDLECYILRMEEVDSVQIYFEHNGNYYSIGGTDEQILLDIIEYLEECKK